MAININELFQPATNLRFVGGLSVGAVGTVVLGIIFTLGAVFTLIFVVMGGIKFITSGGEKEKIDKAKASITYAVVGMTLLILSFVIMYLIQALFINNPNL